MALFPSPILGEGLGVRVLISGRRPMGDKLNVTHYQQLNDVVTYVICDSVIMSTKDTSRSIGARATEGVAARASAARSGRLSARRRLPCVRSALRCLR